MLCSIFLLDEDSLHLRYGVAESLPEAYRAATDGICCGDVGSNGTAAYLRQPVPTRDGWSSETLLYRVDCARPELDEIKAVVHGLE
jgi:hypothetical protein